MNKIQKNFFKNNSEINENPVLPLILESTNVPVEVINEVNDGRGDEDE